MVNRGLVLDHVVLLGRTFEEYSRYFGFMADELRHRTVLDVASGVSSFTAEARALGLDVTAADPIYALPAAAIGPRCMADLDRVLNALDGLTVYRWTYYRDPAHLREFRERAARRFLADFAARPDRYIAASLPTLPFADRQFSVTLVSYLLFLYQEQFSYEFHRDALVEVMRVTREEARVYPLVTFQAERSNYLNRLQADPALRAFRFTEVPCEFDFMINANSYVSIRHG